MSSDINRLESVIRPAVEALGCQLWGYELASAPGGMILRIYIDKEQGINLDDCQEASRQISAVLEVEDLSNYYRLEVSSPGLDRTLFTLAQFEQFIGKQIQVILYQAINDVRRYKGTLKNVEGERIELLVEQGIINLSFDEIKRANVVPEL